MTTSSSFNQIAVVILNYNGENLLEEFLPSVIEHSKEATIYVADNGSTDNSLELIHERFPMVRTIPLGSNGGFCKGYNKALATVIADYYILLNSDVQVTPGWLQPILNLFNNNPQIAAIQPKILSYRQKNKFEYAGAGGGMIDPLGYPYCRGRIFQKIENDVGQYDDECEIFWASGACMAIRSSSYHSLGGLDEDYFAHMEEIDLCWKIHRVGEMVFYTGKSVVYHLGAGTLGYNNPKKTFLNFRNNLATLVKHLAPGEFLWKIPLRFLLDWVAALSFLIGGTPGNFLAVWKAHLHFITDLPKNLLKRRSLRNKYPYYHGQLISKTWILLKRGN